MAEIRITGGCQCGAVRYALSAMPGGGICHCRMCQKASGQPFMAFTGVRLADLTFTRGAPKIFRASNLASRGFCDICGTPLTYQFDGRDRISVTIGSLDHPADHPPHEQNGVESRLPWFFALADLPEDEPPDWLAAVGPIVSHQHPDADT